MNQTLVIAEAGVNHNGDLNLAFRLVEAAANAGADVVKFQTFDAKQLATAAAEKGGAVVVLFVLLWHHRAKARNRLVALPLHSGMRLSSSVCPRAQQDALGGYLVGIPTIIPSFFEHYS